MNLGLGSETRHPSTLEALEFSRSLIASVKNGLAESQPKIGGTIRMCHLLRGLLRGRQLAPLVPQPALPPRSRETAPVRSPK